MRVLQIANYKESTGGISVQVKLIRDHLVADGVLCDILTTKGTGLKRLSAVIELLFLGRRYDVFHVHACSDKGFFPAVIGVGIGRLLKRRVVLTYHGSGADIFFRRRPRLVHFVLTRTDVNIVLSGFIGKVYERFGLSYTIIPNIVELKEGVFRPGREIAPHIISTRSLYDIYNIECTLRALQRVQNSYPRASLVLLGDGPLRGSLEAFVLENRIRNVSFAGLVNNDEIYRYLEECDIMVSSSRFDNMPVSILEGFNAGLLVIASNVGGVPFMVRDGQNGLLFESDDDKELAQKIIYAITHPKEVREMIDQAHLSLRQYGWDSCRSRLMKVYTG